MHSLQVINNTTGESCYVDNAPGYPGSVDGAESRFTIAAAAHAMQEILDRQSYSSFVLNFIVD